MQNSMKSGVLRHVTDKDTGNKFIVGPKHEAPGIGWHDIRVEQVIVVAYKLKDEDRYTLGTLDTTIGLVDDEFLGIKDPAIIPSNAEVIELTESSYGFIAGLLEEWACSNYSAKQVDEFNVAVGLSGGYDAVVERLLLTPFREIAKENHSGASPEHEV